MKEYWLPVGAIALTVIGGVWVLASPATSPPGTPPEEDGVACTMDAKACPDGSYVGRTGPTCEFAACPAAGATTVAIGGRTTIQGTTIGVLELLEDSRCPIDVQCIQAGTVRVRAAVDAMSRDFTFTLNQPQIVGNVTITLVSVIPAEKNSQLTVEKSDYRFGFTVVPKEPASGGVLPYNSGVRGTVLLGPTCPVERDPPDPMCADKPYSTTITVRHTGTTSIVTTGKSDADGTFTFSLAPGKYTLTAEGGPTLPRCNPVEAMVAATGYVTADISCDSGIR